MGGHFGNAFAVPPLIAAISPPTQRKGPSELKKRLLFGRARVAGSLLLSLFLFGAKLGAQPPEARAAEYLDQLWRTSGVPSIAITVAHQRQVVFSRGIGFADLDNMVPATPSTVYNVGSVSKVMAAVAVMQLVEQGKIGLDDPIRKFVPGFPQKDTPITLSTAAKITTKSLS